MIKIYKLIYEGEVVYIGLTKLKLYRRKGSANYSVPPEIYKLCRIELIEETLDKGRERYWIDFYLKNGAKLFNKRGGDFTDSTQAYEHQKKKSKSRYVKKARLKKTDEEKQQIRKSWYEKNKLKIGEKRRLEYKQGKSWYEKHRKKKPVK